MCSNQPPQRGKVLIITTQDKVTTQTDKALITRVVRAVSLKIKTNLSFHRRIHKILIQMRHRDQARGLQIPRKLRKEI